MTVIPLLWLAFAIFVIAAALHRGYRVWTTTEAGSFVRDEKALELDELIMRKAMLMRMIQSARLDLSTGKIEESDFHRIERQLRRETVQVMKRLDALRGSEDDLDRADDELDALFASLRDGEHRWSSEALDAHGGVRPEERT